MMKINHTKMLTRILENNKCSFMEIFVVLNKYFINIVFQLWFTEIILRTIHKQAEL